MHPPRPRFAKEPQSVTVRIFLAPLTIEPMSTSVFSGGTVGHVFVAQASSSLITGRWSRRLATVCGTP